MDYVVEAQRILNTQAWDDVHGVEALKAKLLDLRASAVRKHKRLTEGAAKISFQIKQIDDMLERLDMEIQWLRHPEDREEMIADRLDRNRF